MLEMQDIQSMGGRFFGGGAGGGDRRLRPHLNHNHQALKCPRCDSLNTKFCYYNNYNLSQPRHFCKSCRRYWTKGGVLRNVPVGGGCRKTKRSKPKSSSSSTPSSSPSSPPPPPSQPISDRRASSNSSTASESSSLTAAATIAAAATEAVSAPTSTSSNLLNVEGDSKFFVPHSGGGGVGADASFEATAEGIGIFSEIGSFTSLITASNDVPFGFTNMNDIPASPFRLNNSQHPLQQGQERQQNQWDQNEELKLAEISGGMLDQTAQVDLSVFQNRTNVGGGGEEFGSLDWQPSVDQGLFDLHNSVDQAYWSQGQWTDQDPPSLYIP